jgi:heat shock protein HslJ
MEPASPRQRHPPVPRKLAAHPITRSAIRAFFAVTLFALLASAVACQGSGPGGLGATLAGREFIGVTVVENGAMRPLVAGTHIRVRFDATNVTASAGCNTMGGTYRVQDGRLRYVAGATTAMGCDQERHAQDAWLSGFLASNPAVRLSGNDLVLDGGATVVSLLDREVAEPDAKLVGPTWTLDSIITGDAVSSVPGDVTATLLFKDDGTVDVFAGCNRGSGTWSATGTGITFGPIALTKMACQGPGAGVESDVVGLLGQGSVAAAIDADRLTLQAGGRGLVYRATLEGRLTN